MTVSDPALSDALTRATIHAIDFRSSVDSRLQRPELSYPQMLERFNAPLPEPGLHAMTGRRFFGWVIGSSHPVGVAADWLASAWGQNAGNLLGAPAASACETVAAQWLLELMDLPR